MTPREEQYLDALKKANLYRNRTRDIKKLLREKKITMREVFADPSVQNLYIFDVLMWQPRWASGRATKAMYGAGIGFTVPVKKMTPRQLEALLLITGEG